MTSYEFESLIAVAEITLRVLFVHDHLGYFDGGIHGVTSYFRAVLPAFDASQVESLLCVNGPRHPVPTLLEAVGIKPIYFNRSKWDPRALWDLVRVIREQRIDVLHLTGMKGILLGRIAARLARRPVIVHFHDVECAWPRFLQRRLARWTQWALAVCEPVRRVAIEDFGMPPEKVEVLHNGIDPSQFEGVDQNARRQVRAEFDIDEEAPVLGVLGRLAVAIKGQHLMLRALPDILARCPAAKLLIVGDGPDRAECERLCSALGVLDAVRFTGHREDIAALMSAVDLIVVPSLYEEANPYVVLEAFCAGRPVVAFAVGGIPEIVINGETGLLVPKGDVGGLAGAILRVLEDRSFRERLAEAASRHAENFNVKWHVQRLTEIYRGVYEAYKMRCDVPLAPPRLAEGPR